MALFNDLDGDLVAGLDEERDDGSDAGQPGEAADGRGLAVGAELDVDEDKGETADDVANGQTIQESGFDTGDVGGDDGGGVEADGLEAIVGSGLGAGDALLGLDGLLVGTKNRKGEGTIAQNATAPRFGSRTSLSRTSVFSRFSFRVRGLALSKTPLEPVTATTWGSMAASRAAGTCAC